MELATAAAEVVDVDVATISHAVRQRERLMSTGIGRGLAVPHARLPELTEPVVVVGLSPGGVDFDSPDGLPAQVICLILTPVQDDGAQLEILADIASTFKIKEIREKVGGVSNFTEFLALVRSGQGR